MSDITNNNLTLAILDQKVAGQFAGKRYAYAAVFSGGSKSEFGLGIAVEGERGYSPIDGVSYKTYEEASEIAEGMNRHIGLTDREAVEIVAASMRRD